MTYIGSIDSFSTPCSLSLLRLLAHSAGCGTSSQRRQAVESSYLGQSRGKWGSVFPLELVTASDLLLSCIFIIGCAGYRLWKLNQFIVESKFNAEIILNQNHLSKKNKKKHGATVAQCGVFLFPIQCSLCAILLFSSEMKISTCKCKVYYKEHLHFLWLIILMAVNRMEIVKVNHCDLQ